MILQTNGLPRLTQLLLGDISWGDAGLQALSECLVPGVAPSLTMLSFRDNNFGPVGARALAAALRRGAMPKLEKFFLGYNGGLDSEVIAILAPPLRKQQALKYLVLRCRLGDEGVASLFANLGKDDFMALTHLDLSPNDHMTDKSCACLITALDCDALPRLCQIYVSAIETSEAAVRWVHDALARAVARRAL